MNKYFYPIFKLPTFYERDYIKEELPLYVKWWLLGKAGRELSEILTGSEFTLLHTLNKKFKLLQINGRTEQTQLTGKNIVTSFKKVDDNFFEYYINANFLTNNMIFSGIINANRNSTVYVKAGTLTYTMGTMNFTENQLSQGNMTLTNEQIESIQQETGKAFIQVYANNADFTSLNIQDIMMRNSSITDSSYEPYCRTEYQAQIQTFHNLLKM